MPVLREEIAEGIVIYRADCRDILDQLNADALVTDPPYGIGLTAADKMPLDIDFVEGDFVAPLAMRRKQFKRIPHMHRTAGGYASYDDNYDNFLVTVVPTIPLLLARVKRGAIFMAAKNLHVMPKMDSMGAVYISGGTGRTAWGFTSLHPVALYGRYPGSSPKPLTFPNNESKPVINGHPVPKRLSWMRWLVDLASLEGETVIDPYMGSATTGCACIELGRKFIGVEIDPNYYEIGKRELLKTLNEPQMFKTRPKPVREYVRGLDDPRHTRVMPRVRPVKTERVRPNR